MKQSILLFFIIVFVLPALSFSQSIKAGGYHSIILCSSGNVKTSGANWYGQLGDGTYNDASTPVLVSGLTGVTAVAGGYYHTLALKNDSTVWAWGYNGYGQIGDSTYTERLTPVQVYGLTGIIAISAGAYHSLAVKSDGTVWAWGNNGNGQLGDSTTTGRIIPVMAKNISGITAVAGGFYFSLALKSDSTVWGWGENGNGQLGDNTIFQKITPVQVHGLNDVGFLTGITVIAAGSYHSLARKSDGTAWVWGYNGYGNLGDGTFTQRNTPIQVVSLSTNVTTLGAGFYHSLFVKNDGTAWACGQNWDGDLGDGTNINKTTPVQMLGLTNVVAVAGGYEHSVIMKSDETYWACGYNWYGALGDGTSTDRWVAVPMRHCCPELPEITFSDTCLAMDTTVLGGTSQKVFYIRNDACDTLSVTGFSSSNPAFTVAPSSINVPAYDSVFVTISFSPSALGAYSATLTIFNNDNDTTICLTGFCVPTPAIIINPSSFTVNLACGDSLTDTLFISNTGASGSDLMYSITGNEMYDSTSQVNITLGDQIINHVFSGPASNPDTLFLVLTLNGDYNSGTEYTELYIDGSYQGVVPDTTASYTDFTRYYFFTGSQVDTWLSDGVITVKLDNSPSVGSGGYERVRLYYRGAFSVWLSVNPVQGVIPQGATDTLLINFNTAGMIAGTYFSPFYINSNDPSNLWDTIPVTLNVIGFPDFQFTGLADTASPLCLDLDSIMVSQTSTDMIFITNSDCGILVFDSMTFSSPVFSLDTAPSFILPDDTAGISILFFPVTNGNFSGTVTIYTNDIDTTFCLKGIAYPPPVESHNPDSFNVTLGCGDTVTDFLTIYNTGGSDLYVQLTGAGANQIKVALVPAEVASYITDVQTKLMNTGKFSAVDILDARFTTPTLSQLQAYDAVLTWTDYSYNNATVLGNNLADYVDGGGGVVAAIFTTGNYSRIGGRFDSDNYWCINPIGYNGGGSPTLGTIYNPNHPILKNVSSLNGNPGSAYRPSSTAIMAGAVKVADWSDGMPLVVTKNVNGTERVDLGMWPPSSDAGGGWLASSDGAIMMANALLYSKFGNTAGWMTLSPASDTVAPGDSSIIAVTLNSANLIAGTYTATITITSNDPLTPSDSIPVILNVNGYPLIVLSDTCLVFDTIFQFATITDSFYIRNTGCDTLVLDSLIPSNNEFNVLSYPLFIEPWDSGKIVVGFSPVTINTFNEVLNIYSNLPDTSYCIFAVSLPPPTINLNPDSFTVTLSCSDSITLPLVISNTGSSDLVWTANALATVSDDFDPGIDPSIWSFTDGAANLNCGSVSGNGLFMDNYPTRQAATIDLNTTGGGSIKFYLKLGNNVPGSCEMLDGGNEVYLQYSNNGGGSWNNILTFNAGTYTSFTLVNQAIPPAAQTLSTRFRVWQPTPDCFGCDNWAIDNFSVDFISFVSLSPSSGNTPPGSSDTVLVEFNSSGLITGQYTSTITVTSNDPINPTVIVPCTLNVTGTGILTLGDNCLYLDSIMEFTTNKDSFYIKNTGCDTLIISNVSGQTTDFTFLLSSDTVLMGDSAKLTVTFEPLSTGDFFDTLTIFTNVGDSLICLSGKAFSRPVISVDPDSFNITLACADSLTDTLTIHNLGLNYLIYNIDTGNYVLALDGTGDYVNRGVVNLPTASSQLTIEAWIYPVAYSTDANYTGIVSWGARGCTGNGILLSIQNNGRPSMATWCNDFVPGTGASATLNQWNHIALVRNGTSVTLYMNGTPVSGTISSSIIYGSLNLAIGSTDYPGRYFNGKIDEVRVWNTVRTTGDILSTMNKRLYGNEPGLVSYWNFDKVNANDKTTTGNNGTLIGNAAIVYGSPFTSYYSLNGTLTDTINPGDSTKIAVNFNSTGLTVGTYPDSITITSNDPLGSPMVVPVTVNVVGAGKIALSDTCLYLDSIMEYTTNTGSFYIFNTGCDTLKVTNITTQTIYYSVTGTFFDILPGDSAMVVITFAPESVGFLYDTLTINNSDVTKTVCLSGYGYPRPIISHSPGSVNATLTCADTVIVPVTIYNNGGSDLIFNIDTVDYYATFDGGNDYISVNTIYPGLNIITLEAWIYPTSTTGTHWIISNGRDCCTPTGGFNLFLSGNTLQGQIWRNSSSLIGVGSAGIITLNQWQHVAMVYDGTKIQLFMNGTLVATSATYALSSILNGSLNLHLGILAYSVPNFYDYQGRMDDVRIWNKVRTQGEILSDMNKILNGKEQGLAGYWNFENQNANDVTAFGNNGTIFGNTAFLQYPNNDFYLLSDINDTVPSGDSSVVNVTISSTGLLVGTYYDTIFVQSNDPLSNPDTVLVTLQVTGTAIVVLSDTCLNFDTIMEFTTATRTLAIYNTGCDTLFIDSISFTAAEFTPLSALTYIVPGDSDFMNVQFAPLDTGNFSGTLNIYSNTNDIYVCLTGYAYPRPEIAIVPDSISVTLSCADTIIVPVTIYNNGGTDLIFNIDTTDYYATFDGVNSYINLGTWFNYQTYTIELWVKPGATQKQYADIIDNNHTGSRSWVLQQNSTNTNQYSWGTNDGGGSALFTLTANQWTHIAVTRDGITRTNRVYINGSLFSTWIGTGNIPYDGTQFFRLARWGGGGREWNGAMDEVRVWNITRSQTEITSTMFNEISGTEPNLTGYWNFEKQNANDVTAYGNNGSLFGNTSIVQYPDTQIFTLSSVSDTISPNDSTIINVEISSTGLLVGTYNDTIFIQSNDPLSSINTIPITLQVVGTPIIALSDTCLFFDTIMEFTTATRTLWIYNTGCDTLFVDSISFTDPEFTALSGLSYIVMGDSDFVTVQFAPVSTGAFSSILNVYTNANDTAVCLTGYAYPRPVAGFVPDTFNVTLVCADTLNDTLTIYNPGLSDLIYSTGVFGKSAVFDGSGDYIRTGATMQGQFANETVTLEVWFMANGAGVIVDEMGQTAINSGWHDSQIEILSTGQVRVRVWNLASLSLGTVSFGTWNHAVLRYNKSTLTLDGLLNGVEAATDVNGDRNAPWEGGYGQYYALGATDGTNLGSGAYFNGKIDEFRVWNTARTNAQIQANMNKTLYGNEAGLVAYWNFDDGTATDISSNSFDGTFAGNAATDVPNAPVSPVWLDFSLITDTVTTGDSVKIPVDIISTGLLVGQYNTYIEVTTNDPLNDTVFIPVILNVIGTGEITLSDTCLDFDTIMELTSASRTFILSNTGCDTLNGYLVSSSGYFSLNTAGNDSVAINILPGGSVNTTVIFAPDSVGAFTGSVNITTNAGDSSICLNGNTFPMPTVCYSPDSINVYFPICLDTIMFPVQVCNSGGSGLYSSLWSHYGRGLTLDGSGDYVTIPDNPSLRLTTAFTIEAWIKPTILTGFMQVISKFGWTNNYSYQMNTTNTGKLRVDLSTTGTTYTNNMSTASLTAGVWNHVAATWDGSTVKLFINGVQDASTLAFTGTLFGAATTVDIGRVSGSANQQFNGQIDEVRVYNRALSSLEILNTMNATLSGNENGLMGSWNFDDGTAGDMTPNNNNGALFGNAAITLPTVEFIPPVDTVLIADTNIALVRLIKTGLPYGIFNFNAYLASNDPLNPEVIIPVTLNIDSLPPSSPVAADRDVCSGDPVPDLIAVGTGDTIKWYDLIPTLLFTGDTFPTSETAVGIYSYLVNQTDTNGCISSSDTVVLAINAAPGEPVANDTTVCSDATIPLLSSTGTIIKWYSDGALTTLLFTGNPYNTGQTLPASYTYYVTDSTGACPSSTADTVTLTINNAATVNAGINDVICEGSTYTLSGTRGGGATTSTWTTSGTGTFNDSSLLAAVYTPSLADITTGSVTLTLTTDDPDGIGPCSAMADAMLFTINPAATVSAGIDDTICSGSTYTLSGSRGGSATSSSWTTLGSGTFNNAALLNATYTPSAGDISAGSISLVLTTNDPAGPCPSVTDTMVITINIAGTANAGADAPVCSGNNFILSGAIGGGASTSTWTTSGSGTFNDSSLLAAIYTPSAGDITMGSVTLTITTNDPDGAGPCGVVLDAMVLTINTAPGEPVANDTTVCSDAGIPSLSSTGTIVQWYSDGALTNLLFTGNPYNTGQTLPNSYTYYVTDSTGACPESFADTVTLTINNAATVNAGINDVICEGSAYTLSGIRGGGATASTWTTSGTGTFNDSSLLAAVYSPSLVDIAMGSVTLTLSTDDPDGIGPCTVMSDAMLLTINPAATVNAGADDTICSGSTYTLSGTKGGSATSSSWTTLGTGTFNNASLLNATYTPSPADIIVGSAVLLLTTNDPAGPCPPVSDTVVITINIAGTANAGADVPLCAGDLYTLSGAIGGGATSLVWTTSGSGTFNDSSLLAAIYTPSAGDITMGSVTLTITTNDPDGAGPCGAVTDDMVLSINAPPVVPSATDTTICSGAPVPVLSANGTIVQWYSDAALTILINTGTSYNTGQTLPGVYNYYVTDSTSGCPETSADTATLAINDAATVNAGSDASLCEGDSYTLSGTRGGGATSSVWTTSGTGSFNDSSLVAAAYTPSAADISAGVVTLTITTNDPDGGGPCAAVSDPMVLNINAPAVKPAGTDTTACSDASIPLLAASGTFLQWYSDASLTTLVGTGSSYNTGQTLPGSYNYYVTDSTSGCPESQADTVTLTINNAATVNSGSDAIICEGDADTLSGTIGGGASGGVWTTSGSGIFNDSSLLSAVYSPSLADIAMGNVTLTLTSNDPDGTGPCLAAIDAMTLTINPAATVNAGTDAVICEGNFYTLSGSIGGGASSSQWTTAGSGTFDIASLLTATYTPSPGDITSGNVQLILTSNDPAGPCVAVSDTMVLTINMAATVNAGIDNAICSGDMDTLYGTIGGGASGGGWTTSGTGTFDDSSSLAAIYAPSAVDISTGSVTFTLTTNDPDSVGPCPAVSDALVLTINPIPSAPVASPDTLTCFGSPVPDLYSTGGTNIKWYSDAALTTLEFTGDTFITGITTAGLFTFYVTQTVLNCQSPSDSVTLNVYQVPAPVTLDTAICVGDPVPDLTATGNNIKWYSNDSLTTLVGTGNSFNTGQTVAGVYTYFVTDSLNTCISVAAKSTLIISTFSTYPDSVIADGDSICEGSAVRIWVVGGLLGVGADWAWYADSCGGLPIAFGDTAYVNPAVTTTYFVRGEGGCDTTACRNVIVQVTKTISVFPFSATASADSICPGVTSLLSLTGGSLGTGAIWEWYSGSCGLTAQGSGTAINVNPASTTNYFVRAEGTCNTTACQTVTVSVTKFNSVAPTAVSASGNSICPGSSVNLSFVGGWLGTGATWEWYTSGCGTVSAGGGDTIPVSPFTTTTYYLRAEGVCNTTVCDSITINVTQALSVAPAGATATATVICSGDATDLVVSGGSLGTGAAWNWYADSCNGTFAGSGDTLTVTPLSSAAYFVKAEGNCNSTSCAGVSITVNSIPTAPVANNETVCEGDTIPGLIASGTSVNWYDTAWVFTGNTFSTGKTIPGVYVYYATQTINNCEGPADTVSLTITALPAAPSAADQWVCLGNPVPDLVAAGTNIVWYSDSTLLTIAGTGNSFTTGDTALGIYTYYATQTVTGCEGPDNAVSLTISLTPPKPTASDKSACEVSIIPPLTASGTVLKWYSDSSLTNYLFTGSSYNTGQSAPGVYTYYVTDSLPNCVSSAEEVVLTIIQMPSKPVGTDETVCYGDTVPDMYAAGNNPQWYKDPALVIFLAAGNSYSTGIASVGSYKFYVTDKVTGCPQSSSDTVVLTINPVPLVTLNQYSTSIEIGDTAVLIAYNASSYTWSPTNTIAPDTGAKVLAFPLSNTVYTVTGTNEYGCTNTASVTVTVKGAGIAPVITDDFGLMIYPNPTQNKVTVEFNLPSSDKNNPVMTVFNMLGEVIVQGELNNFSKVLNYGKVNYRFEIDFNDKAEGVYYMQLTTDEVNVVRKIVVVR